MTNLDVDRIFATLADPTRRAVIERLADGPAPVKELAAPHDMALPSFLKHLDVLERTALISSRKVGRQRICTLHPAALAPVETWLNAQRRLWEARTDRLAALAERIESEPDTPSTKQETSQWIPNWTWN